MQLGYNIDETQVNVYLYHANTLNLSGDVILRRNKSKTRTYIY